MAEFLLDNFTRLNQPIDDDVGAEKKSENIRGEAAPDAIVSHVIEQDIDWDRELDDKTKGWEQAWDENSQSFYYFNQDTLETSFAAPFKASVSSI